MACACLDQYVCSHFQSSTALCWPHILNPWKQSHWHSNPHRVHILWPWKHRVHRNSVILANPKSGTYGEMDTWEPWDLCWSDVMDKETWNPSELGNSYWLIFCTYRDTDSMETVRSPHINKDVSDTPITLWPPQSDDPSLLSTITTKKQTWICKIRNCIYYGL